MLAGRTAEAIPIYESLVHANPNSAELHLNLAIADYKDKRYRETAEHAAAALRLRPDLVGAKLFLGAAEVGLGEYRAAVEPLRAVVAANPRDRNAHLLLARALAGSGDDRAAVDEFRTCAAMMPDNPAVWYGLGQTYERLHQSSDAEEAYAHLQTLPPFPESHEHAAQVLDARGRYADAAVEWREAAKLAPDNVEIQVALAWSLYRARDHAAVLEIVTDLLKKPADGLPRSELNFLAGAALLGMEQPEKAIPWLRAAGEFAPAQAALGQALLLTGKAAEAIPLLRAALAADEDGSTHFQLARAYQLTGDAAAAKAAMEDYRRLRGVKR